MTYPDDRVLVGVINRKTDLTIAQKEHWYRIPKEQMPRGVDVEYIALYLSGYAAKEVGSGIHYYAKKTGLELKYRKDLLPKEASHDRAMNEYYQVQFQGLIPKNPPVLNPTNRRFAFIYTTWDRFVHAEEIADLYSKADYYVDRIYHALRDKKLTVNRYWSTEKRSTGYAPQLRLLCEDGEVVASTDPDEGDVYLNSDEPDDKLFAEIRRRVAEQGGPVLAPVPIVF